MQMTRLLKMKAGLVCALGKQVGKIITKPFEETNITLC